MSYELLTAEEVASRLRMQPTTIRQWSRTGQIPRVRLSPKIIRYRLDAVVKALISNCDKVNCASHDRCDYQPLHGAHND